MIEKCGFIQMIFMKKKKIRGFFHKKLKLQIACVTTGYKQKNVGQTLT